MHFEDALEAHAGGWGRGQAIILMASSMSWVSTAMAALSMVFVTAHPLIHCINAADAVCAAALTPGADPGALCALPRTSWAWVSPNSSLVSEFDLVCGQAWKLGMLNGAFFIGFWLGSCGAGWLADVHGRRLALLASNLASAVAALLCSKGSTYTTVLAARAMLGACIAGLPVAAYVLATESVAARLRGRAGTASQLCYHIGEWLLPAAAALLADWRQLHVALAAACCTTAALVLPLPESPRWLALRGRHSEAAAAMSWLARHNRHTPRTAAGHIAATAAAAAAAAAAAETTVVTAAMEAEQCEAAAVAEPSDSTALLDVDRAHLISGPHTNSTRKDKLCKGEAAKAKQEQQQLAQPQPLLPSESAWLLLRAPLLRHLFLVTTLLCLVLALTFYVANLALEGLMEHGNLSLPAAFLVTSAGELPVVLLAAVAVDWIGRRATLVVGMLTTGAACCACAALPAGSVSAIAFVALGKAACSAAWTIAYIYAAELVPTSVRSAALAGNNQASRLGGVLAPALVYAGQRACAGVALPFAVGGAATLLVTALLMWLPETRGQRQPDTLAELLDLYGGDSAQYWGSNEHSAGSNAIMPRQPSALQRLLSGLTRTASGSEHYTPAWRAPSANQLPSHGLELHPSGPVMRSESS